MLGNLYGPLLKTTLLVIVLLASVESHSISLRARRALPNNDSQQLSLSKMIDLYFNIGELECPVDVAAGAKDCVDLIFYLGRESSGNCGSYNSINGCIQRGFSECNGPVRAVTPLKSSFAAFVKALLESDGCSVVAEGDLQTTTGIPDPYQVVTNATDSIFTIESLRCPVETINEVNDCVKGVISPIFDLCGRFQPVYDCYHLGFKTCKGGSLVDEAEKAFALGYNDELQRMGCSVITGPTVVSTTTSVPALS